MADDIQKLKERLENPSDLAGAIRGYLDQLMEDELASALRKEMGIVVEEKNEDDVDDETEEDKRKKKSSEDEDDEDDDEEEDE